MERLESVQRLIGEANDALHEAEMALERDDWPEVYQALVEAEDSLVGAQYVTDAGGRVTRKLADLLSGKPSNEG